MLWESGRHFANKAPGGAYLKGRFACGRPYLAGGVLSLRAFDAPAVYVRRMRRQPATSGHPALLPRSSTIGQRRLVLCRSDAGNQNTSFKVNNVVDRNIFARHSPKGSRKLDLLTVDA